MKFGGFTARLESDTADRYVVYNYLDNIWYYGTMDSYCMVGFGFARLPTSCNL